MSALKMLMSDVEDNEKLITTRIEHQHVSGMLAFVAFYTGKRILLGGHIMYWAELAHGHQR